MIAKIIHISFFLFFIILASCNNDDVGYSPISENYLRAEFDTILNSKLKKNIGVSFIALDDFQDLDNLSVYFQGIYKGDIFIFSNECSVDYHGKYDGVTKIDFKSIIKEENLKRICSFDVYLKSEKIKKINSYEEKAKIYFIFENLIKSFKVQLLYNTDSKNFIFEDNASIQIRASNDISNNRIIITNDYLNSWEYEVSGCGSLYSGTSDDSKAFFSLEKIFNKIKVEKSDSCLMHVKVKNFDNTMQEIYIYLGIYDANVKKLENMKFYIQDDKIYAEGLTGIKVCSINTSNILFTCLKDKVVCSRDYDPEKVFWIRGITSNGRKSVIGIKDNQIFWEE